MSARSLIWLVACGACTAPTLAPEPTSPTGRDADVVDLVEAWNADLAAADRDAKRRALTAEYEREMQKLDEDEFTAGETLPAKGGGLGGGEGVNGLREQVAAAVAAQTHQDVEHQDIDIDVMMMHIDKDGDGVITPSEAYGVYPPSSLKHELQRGGWPLYGPALIGCLCSVVCYLSLRSLLHPRLLHPRLPSGRRPPAASRRGVITRRPSAAVFVFTRLTLGGLPAIRTTIGL